MKILYVCLLSIIILTSCASTKENHQPTPDQELIFEPLSTVQEPDLPTPSFTPSVLEPEVPDEPAVFSIMDESSAVLDVIALRMDGVEQTRFLGAVYRDGRLWIDTSAFAKAFGLPETDGKERSLFELCEQFGLTADFDWKNDTISLYSGYERPERRPAEGTRNAIIRLEDIAAFGSEYAQPRELIKMRTIADLLWEYNANFSIAWVPVYVRASDDYINDVTQGYSRYNMEFVFTMDYMISRGGVLGLHGYTHQHGKENSIAGYEFGAGINDDEETTRMLYQQAINAAETLGWTPYFFEFPHYAASKQQYAIAEEFFDIIYTRPYGLYPSKPYYVKNGQRSILYLHTPQDYVYSNSETDVAAMIYRINGAGELCSLFFHPHLEYDSISVSRDDDNPPAVSYDTNSPLHRILDALIANNRIARTPMYFQE